MGGNPRALRPHVPRPSPLQQVHLTRPLSQAPPASGLVRDPQFWKRFSVAVHAAEVDVELGPAKSRSNSSGSGSSVGIEKRGDDWLVQQHREKRRCRTLCITITMAVIFVITAAAVAGWYFTHEWKKPETTSS